MVKKGRLKKREKKKKRGDFKLLSVHLAFNGAFLRVLPLLGCALWSDKSRAGEKNAIWALCQGAGVSQQLQPLTRM